MSKPQRSFLHNSEDRPLFDTSLECVMQQAGNADSWDKYQGEGTRDKRTVDDGMGRAGMRIEHSRKVGGGRVVASQK